MGFYFVVHTLLGLVAASSAQIVTGAKHSVASYPLWVQNSVWASGGAFCSMICAFLAIPTTFFSWGLTYTFYTIGEIILGLVIAGLMPQPIKILMLIIGPIVSIVIMGALWGFWYI